MNISQNKRDFRGNIFSQITFLWLEKLFFKGYRRKLKESDLHPCPMEHRSKELYGLFVEHWEVELKKINPDIKVPLAKTLRNTFLIASLFILVDVLLLLLQAILVSYFSSICMENTSFPGTSIAVTLAITLIVLYLPISHVCGHYLLNSVGLQLRSICTTALFKKILALQQTVLHKASVGHIINLVSNDVYKLEFGASYWSYIVIAPIILAISTGIMLVYIGPIGMVGVLYLALHSPLQVGLAFLFGHFRYLQSVTADNRVRIMDQIIRGMLVIKFYVWETPFVEYIRRIRRKEVFYASLSGFSQSINFSFFSTSLFIALFLTFSVSVALSEPVSTAQLGLIFLVLNSLRTYGVLMFGQGVFSLRECIISLKRIQRILELPENTESCITMKSCTPTECPAIKLYKFSASWRGTEKANSNSLVLKSIQLTLESNQLVAIAGLVGSGKSSLLLSLINELPGLSGHLTVTGKVSYASQEPWIFSGTIRDNILFGNPLNTERYWEVINACCLTEDIDSYTDRDMTLIGERGVTLSGGQKARVSLARSVYHKADIYLFDDPLSAVDARVGRELFVKCMRGLLRSKLIIMVTHHIHYVRQADCVVVMSGGEIVSSGTYRDIVNRSGFCREFLQGLEESDKKVKTEMVGNSISYKSEVTVENNEESRVVQNSSQNLTIDKRELDYTQPLSTALTTEDYRPNSIGTLTYVRYFGAGGVTATIILLLLTVVSNAALLLAYWWMQSIAKCSESSGINSTDTSNATKENNLIVCAWYFSYYDLGALRLLALFTFSGSISMFLRGFNFYYVVLQASRRLHNRMLHRLVHTPIHFFETNPSGRILNRFSKDIGFLDEQLPRFFYDFWQFSTYLLSTAIATCAVQVFMIIPFFIAGVSTLAARHWYLRTSTQIKRIESISRSPLYSHISLVLQGLCTIRALQIEDRITQDFHFLQDNHTRSWYHYIACNRWFSLRLDYLAAVLVLFALFAALLARCVFGIDELIGFSIPLLLTIPGTFQYVVRMSGEVEVFMVSTDRILNYCKLPQERSYNSSSHNRNCSIISNAGGIEYKNVFYNYSKELPYSLVAVSLRVLPGEKIGIIGRTGAGKSSLFNSLFLMTGISSGSISIGGEDISSLNLYEHRKRLSAIPQDPFLFSGTLRYNLDPFEEFSCEEIWDALKKSHLKSFVEKLPGELLASVEEDGRNFSTGERQLLCLARALLRGNCIIVVDEATANVDMHTDLLVQQAIRTHFSHCTVLTIAHRIETVIDSDRIVVIDKATVVEVGIPFLLLRDDTSYLSKFISQLDPVAQTHLRGMAQQAYYK